MRRMVKRQSGPLGALYKNFLSAISSRVRLSGHVSDKRPQPFGGKRGVGCELHIGCSEGTTGHR